MEQLRLVLKRLRKPSVIVSILAQIAMIISAFKFGEDINIITCVILSLCSIFVILGILSNPSTRKKGYGDDILKCGSARKMHEHVKVAGKMICTECGCTYEEKKKEKEKK